MWREGDRRQPLKEFVDREALNLAGAERCRSVRHCPLDPCQISYCMGDSRVLLISAEGEETYSEDVKENCCGCENSMLDDVLYLICMESRSPAHIELVRADLYR